VPAGTIYKVYIAVLTALGRFGTAHMSFPGGMTSNCIVLKSNNDYKKLL